MATFDDFMKLDIRVGTVISAKVFEKARKPAYQLEIDFGEEIGVKKSSAQITDFYNAEDLIGKQIMGVVNFPPRQIADFMSEVLVPELGARLGNFHVIENGNGALLTVAEWMQELGCEKYGSDNTIWATQITWEDE